MRREICEITRESFAAYGTVLEFSGPQGLGDRRAGREPWMADRPVGI